MTQEQNSLLSMKRLVGVFKGEILCESCIEPVTTEFFWNQDRSISGKYTIKTYRKTYEGVISNITHVHQNFYAMDWEEINPKKNKGSLHIVLAEDNEAFTGYWGDNENTISLPWTGLQDEDCDSD